VLRLGVPATWPHAAVHQSDRVDYLHLPRSLDGKRWRNGQMAALVHRRLVEAAGQFRRVNGRPHLPKLRDALGRPFRSDVTPYATTRP
jgi:hypothetical protein